MKKVKSKNKLIATLPPIKARLDFQVSIPSLIFTNNYFVLMNFNELYFYELKLAKTKIKFITATIKTLARTSSYI